MWQLSIRSKIILTLLLTGLACLAAGAIIGYRAGEAALTRSVEEQLTALWRWEKAILKNIPRFKAADL
jgi:hypothetical protein